MTWLLIQAATFAMTWLLIQAATFAAGYAVTAACYRARARAKARREAALDAMPGLAMPELRTWPKDET